LTPVASSPTPTPRPIAGRIVYVHNSGELGGVPVTDIWVIDAHGGQPTAMTSDPQNEFSPFWLLDGSRLVFAVFDFAKNPYYGRLVSVLPDGSGRRDLAPVANYGDAVLSPDGRYVAWGGGGATDGKDGITFLDRSTGEAKLLTTGGETDPIWSPDGRALLVREPELGAVAVVEVPSGRVTRFKKPDIERVIGWTADGGSIVFSGPESAETPIWMAPRAGGPVVLLPSDAALAAPMWSSPDGRRFVEPGTKGNALAQFVVGGLDPVAFASGVAMRAGPPTWSPESTALAFAGSTPDEVADGKSGIFIWSVDSKAPERITGGPQDTSPAWGPSQ
jgi:Tol biopolymer transport system component